jgi:hypothetical protein
MKTLSLVLVVLVLKKAAAAALPSQQQFHVIQSNEYGTVYSNVSPKQRRDNGKGSAAPPEQQQFHVIQSNEFGTVYSNVNPKQRRDIGDRLFDPVDKNALDAVAISTAEKRTAAALPEQEFHVIQSNEFGTVYSNVNPKQRRDIGDSTLHPVDTNGFGPIYSTIAPDTSKHSDVHAPVEIDEVRTDVEEQ